ncbi:recombinase family protein [Desulfosporosinus hippei]|uniref:Site-specific DNA recombinase n=1 Tax=Desulfosporosinus hippei DSM 8344 TaxID=1121419 RepID=A0A1G8CA24_9FIRM|nr:recombinase family protein [Desulfosporosinus hippei]SDH42248.1 Site-specific DNA recombinase [Desulfosporosinus hippei DSM 8344]
MDDEKILINDVAIYLRKSHGDYEEDLENHRHALVELCEKIGCKYTEFAEIGNSDSIQDRPEFIKMLGEVKQGLYDAVAVIDIDRLGRGDDGDWSKIETIFRDAEVLILTPDKVYDLENENDEFQFELKKFFARLEYKQISKRFRRGKITGAKRGRWTNGKPPYPYEYNAELKKLEVNEEKRKVYRLIINMSLQGQTAEQIAWKLNEIGYKSPGGKFWSSTAIYRLLRDQTHLGKIIIHKSKGSGHKNKKTKPLKVFEKEEWIIIDGEHEKLKLIEEHQKICELFAKRKIIPRASRRGAFLFSGLVYCGKCGYSMQFTYNGVSKIEYVKKCQKTDPYGNRCGNQGLNTQIFEKAIFDELKKYEEEIINKKYEVNSNELEVLIQAINQKEMDVLKENKALDTLQEQRENQEISKERFLERKAIREDNLKKLNREIGEYKERLEKREQTSNEKRLTSIRDFYNQWSISKDTQERNNYLKTIIDKISYTRDGNRINVKINFL